MVIEFSNLVKIQWGLDSSDSTYEVSILFPISFQTCVIINSTRVIDQNNAADYSIQTYSLTGFSGNKQTKTSRLFWTALGF